MSISVIARAPMRSRPLVWSRSLHASSPRLGGHGAYTTVEAVPFSFKSGPTFALKIVTFLGFGFSIPIIASVYQLSKK